MNAPQNLTQPPDPAMEVKKINALCAALARQREGAMDALARAQAELAIARERLYELEDRVKTLAAPVEARVVAPDAPDAHPAAAQTPED